MIAPSILSHFSSLNPEQRRIVETTEGPVLIIAGPGSGKTFSLVLRTLNLLCLGKAKPSEIVVCTFTEKAALELRDRINAGAAKIGYTEDLTELRVGTIHGICHDILNRHRHHTKLGNSFQILDGLTQQLFLFEQFDTVFGPPVNDLFLGKWSTKWTAIEGAISFFNKITEEQIDATRLQSSPDAFLSTLGGAYLRYRQAQYDQNRIDFAVIQSLAFDVLSSDAIGSKVCAGVRYLMVDEYQDTNYIQERLLLKMASAHLNVCVVGDEDQSLYRFRGATVRNILEFPNHFPSATQIPLTTNYRSHKSIISAYDRWMASADWSGPGNQRFRFDKSILPNAPENHPDYPAVFSIWTQDPRDEAERFASLVKFLKDSSIIEDYSQVALLLRSVQTQHSGRFTDALKALGIPAYCPRARGFFEGEEIQWMMACYALIFGWHGAGRGEVKGPALTAFATYIDRAFVSLAGAAGGGDSPLSKLLRQWVGLIEGLNTGESLDLRVADFLYRLLAVEPFASVMKEENRARSLAILTQLLNSFQSYYHYTIITHKNREWIRRHLFNSFFRLLHESGLNEFEDPDQPLPKGHVQILTIHQSKGLEFPVVVVGSLDANISTGKQVDQLLGPFCQRPVLEPTNRITGFDRMRLHYVAFSRAARLLVLTCGTQPKDHFREIWDGLPQWPHIQRDLLTAQRFEGKDRHPVKKRFSFTGDLRVYETCPRQYQYYRYLDFTPSRSAVIFFGLLVHQSIEEIHRLVLDGLLDQIDDARVLDLFEKTYRFLCLSDVRPTGPAAKENALKQVLDYFHQNRDAMQRVRETEVDVSLEKDGYILTGKVDLLMGSDGKLELLDFKTSERPAPNDPILDVYEKQLCTYAHILEQRYGKRPERLLLYWTAEEKRSDALMEFDYHPQHVEAAGKSFDQVVAKIQDRDFNVVRPPGRKVCKECDLKAVCAHDGLIKPFPS
ncbi:ATP-dependent DNA helicase [Nibricoccus sp. IMCC34717]|uniref:ATP-dependent DNA helicase n=1 Tax=Nibricoccus sp. IMCC34717 TaxID=3034021 RepID=UPI00384A4D1B